MLGWGDSLSLELQSLASVNYFLHYPQIPSDNNDPPYTMSVNVLHTCCTLLWVKYAGGESEAVWSKERERPAALVCRLNVCVVIFLPHVGLISLERSRHDVGLMPHLLWPLSYCLCLLYNWRNKKERQKTIPFGLFFLVAVHAVPCISLLCPLEGRQGQQLLFPHRGAQRADLILMICLDLTLF